jgi:hypothetical protein
LSFDLDEDCWYASVCSKVCEGDWGVLGTKVVVTLVAGVRDSNFKLVSELVWILVDDSSNKEGVEAPLLTPLCSWFPDVEKPKDKPWEINHQCFCYCYFHWVSRFCLLNNSISMKKKNTYLTTRGIKFEQRFFIGCKITCVKGFYQLAFKSSQFWDVLL